jgi:uncharacterized protein YqfA (UPF0365 family)
VTSDQIVLTLSGAAVAFTLLAACFVVAVHIPMLIRARRAGVQISMLNLFGMRARKVNPSIIVDGAVELARAGLARPWSELEVHHLAGGRVGPTVRAYIEAQRLNASIMWSTICAIDLGSREPTEQLAEALDKPLRGTAATDINALGFAMLAGQRTAVFNLDDPILAGEPVRVVLSEGNLIGVRRDT